MRRIAQLGPGPLLLAATLARMTSTTSTRPATDLEEITITKDGIFANTEAGAPMKPLDHIIHPNRHERRKAKALARRECRAIGADW